MSKARSMLHAPVGRRGSAQAQALFLVPATLALVAWRLPLQVGRPRALPRRSGLCRLVAAAGRLPAARAASLGAAGGGQRHLPGKLLLLLLQLLLLLLLQLLLLLLLQRLPARPPARLPACLLS